MFFCVCAKRLNSRHTPSINLSQWICTEVPVASDSVRQTAREGVSSAAISAICGAQLRQTMSAAVWSSTLRRYSQRPERKNNAHVDLRWLWQRAGALNMILGCFFGVHTVRAPRPYAICFFLCALSSSCGRWSLFLSVFWLVLNYRDMRRAWDVYIFLEHNWICSICWFGGKQCRMGV